MTSEPPSPQMQPPSHPPPIFFESRSTDLKYMINVCCCLEVCCRGRSLPAGSCAVAIFELFGAMLFLIWPLLIISGAVKGLAAQVNGSAGGIKSRSGVAERVVVYEARMLYGEKMYILGTEPGMALGPGTNGRMVGDQAITVDLQIVGFTSDKLKEVSTVTVLLPFSLCICIFLASVLLLIAANLRNSIVGIISGFLHGLATFMIFGYFIYICVVINDMMGPLKNWQDKKKPGGSSDSFERISLTWPVWLQLFHLLLFPGAFYGTLCAMNLALMYHKDKPAQDTFDWEGSTKEGTSARIPDAVLAADVEESDHLS